MDTKIDISFVCCIEAGVLEDQTIRMIASLRKFAGRYSDAPVFAVTPRAGPSLSANTLQALKAFDVTHLIEYPKTGYEWFNFINKPLALAIANKHITTETVAWLDGDLLFLSEPTELHLLPSEDFAGFPVESKEMGTSGPKDPYDSLWAKACDVVDVDLQALPFITTAQTNENVRLYFNGGIFVYRRSTAFAVSYLNMCTRLLDSKIITAAPGYSHGFKEMSAIGFAVIKLELRWRALPYSHDYVMLSSTHSAWYKESALAEAKVVHYHDAMWPWFWTTFCECLKATHPQVATWLLPFGPMENKASWISKVRAIVLRAIRQRRASNYTKSCTVV